MYPRLVHRWSTRAKQAVIQRIPSYRLPRHARIFLTAPHAVTALDLQHGQGEQPVPS